MNKLIVLFLLTFSNSQPMNFNTLKQRQNDTNVVRFPLHLIVMGNTELNEEEAKKSDQLKASSAAQLIYYHHQSVSEQDALGKTVLDYAQENKDKFPRLWKVIEAGKALQDAQSSINVNLASILDLDRRGTFFAKMPTEQKYSWCAARSTLEHYLPAKIEIR